MIVRGYLLAGRTNRRWCLTVQVVCKDGTTIQCQHFRAIDSGVLLFEESDDSQAESEDEAEREATGFVPITELRFVLPDEAMQRAGAHRPEQAERGGRGQAMPGGQAQPPRQRPQQGGMQQQPGPTGQGPYESGGQ